MKCGSLFAGIGGFDLGLERAGFRTVWQVEKEPYRRAVLAKHFPHATRYEDVREVGSHNLEAVDLICGGFPCTDISVAGRGAGIDGEQSGLWREMLRVVCELRPRYVLVENVAALLGRGLGRVVGDLAQGGYDAEWDCIPASAFGAPHRRDRLWIVAYTELPRLEGLGADTGQPQVTEPRNGGGEVGHPEGNGCGEGRARRSTSAGTGQREPERALQDSDERALQSWRVGGRAAQAGGSEWWSVEPPMGRVAHGISNRLDQLAAIGDALVPQIAEWLGHRILEYETVTP